MRRASLAGGMFLVALIFCFPLRLAAEWLGFDRNGVVAREVSGSVWNGRLSEARLANLAIGDIDAGLDPLPLAAGRVQVHFRRGDEGSDAYVYTLGRNRYP